MYLLGSSSTFGDEVKNIFYIFTRFTSLFALGTGLKCMSLQFDRLKHCLK